CGELRVQRTRAVRSRKRMAVRRGDLASQYRRYWQLFDDMPQPYVVTKPDSTILEVNRAASELFNVSQRFLVGKTLSVFVGQDRVLWLNDVRRAAAGGTTELAFRLRPGERAAIPVTARIRAEGVTPRWA